MEQDELGIDIVNMKDIFVKESPDGKELFLEDPEGGDAPSREDLPGASQQDQIVTEENPASKKEGENSEPAVSTGNSNAYFKDVIKKLGGLGIISPVSDEDEFADDEGNSVKFSELPIDDEETFNAYLKSLYEKKNEGESEKKIDLDGVSDLTKKIIEIDKAGGDITSILKIKADVINPMENIDLDDVNGQKLMVAHYLSAKYPGMGNDEIKGFVDTYEAQGVLESKAIASKKALEDAFNDYTEKEKKRLEDEKVKFSEQYKVYKKSLKESIANRFQLKDEYIKKAIDFATTLDERNNPKLVNQKYSEMLNNPETAADLIMFLYNKDEYDKQRVNKAVTQERKNVFKQISVKSKTPDGSVTDAINEKRDEEGFKEIKEKVVIKGDF